jgi:hypothetical protein
MSDNLPNMPNDMPKNFEEILKTKLFDKSNDLGVLQAENERMRTKIVELIQLLEADYSNIEFIKAYLKAI